MTDAKIPQMPTYLQPEPLPEDPDTYEYVSEDGELTAKELKILNLHGYVYQSEQTDVDFDQSELTDVDFDYEDLDGNQHTGYQDIYYFIRIKL